MSLLPEQVRERLIELRDRTRYYGLMMGSALILIELIQYWQHDTISIASTFFLLIFKIGTMFVTAYYLAKRIKDGLFKDGMSYAQSFSIIFRLFVYGSLIVGLFSFVLNRWIAPEYTSEVLENSATTLKSYIEAAQLPTGQSEYVDSLIEKISESPTPSPLSTMWGLMWSYLFWGGFTGAIVSFFIRDKNITPLSQQES